MKTNTREVLFQEDNQGQGPSIAEVHWPNGWRSFYKPLSIQILDTFIAEGVTEIFLTYRGCWDPRNLYRDQFPKKPNPIPQAPPYGHPAGGWSNE